MDLIKRFLEICTINMEVPTPFGWFHLMFWGITIAAAILLCVTDKKNDPDRARRVVLVMAIIVILLEIYKQIVFTFSISDGEIVANFMWYSFPFQFCSMPMYVGLLAGVTKHGRLHDACCTFLATYALFAGFCVMMYPVDVFIDILGINIQTMIWHGSMVSIGVYLLYSGHIKLRHKTILGALVVFTVCIVCAMILNEIVYYTVPLDGDSFNMFFISRHFEGTLPVYSSVQKVIPFPFCVIIYIAAFSLVAYLILLLTIGIQKLSAKVKLKADVCN